MIESWPFRSHVKREDSSKRVIYEEIPDTSLLEDRLEFWWCHEWQWCHECQWCDGTGLVQWNLYCAYPTSSRNGIQAVLSGQEDERTILDVVLWPSQRMRYIRLTVQTSRVDSVDICQTLAMLKRKNFSQCATVERHPASALMQKKDL